MKLQILTTTALLLMASATSASHEAIAALSTQHPDAALQPVSSVAIDDGVNYQKQSSERDRQRREELQQRERDRQRDAEQRQRDRDSDDWDDDDDDDDAPWWSSDDGWDAREHDRDRQRDARQREEDRRDLEERLEDRRDRDDDYDDDYDDDDDYYDDDDDYNNHDDDFWRQWGRQRELLQRQWNNWRSSVPSSFASSTRVDLTSLSQDAVTVAIDSINGEQALTFAGNTTQHTVNLTPGTYKVQFSEQDGDRIWQSGYLNVGRTDALRIVFDPQRRTVQVYNDPYAWTPEDSVVSSDE
jgi:hypothetical protein